MATVEYGVPSDEEREQQAAVLRHAFAMKREHLVTSLQWAGHDNLRVVRDGGDVLGCMTLVRMGQFFGGRSVPMTGIAGVATRPDASRRGVATTLMFEGIRELAREGVPLSTLFASTQTLYRKAGYEAAGGRYEGRLQPQRIEFADRDLTLRLPRAADRPAVETFYRTHCAVRNGHLDRGTYIWNRVLLARLDVETHGVLACDGDEIEGYVFYRKPSSNWPQTISVTDMQARTPRGYRRLWTFLRDLSTSVVGEVVVYTAPADPAYLVHPHAFFGLRQDSGWMLRIVDAQKALVARGYAPHIDAELHLELRDDIVDANNGRFVLRVRDGAATVDTGGDGHLQLDVRGLAALYTGFATAHDLTLLERASGRPDALATASALFAGPAPWMPDMF